MKDRFKTKPYHKVWIVIRFLILFLLSTIQISGQINMVRATAQVESEWSTAQIIPIYENDYPPYMVSDQNRTVHAFYDKKLNEGGKAILYRYWKQETGWSLPVDILLPYPTINNPVQGVFLDKAGMFHIIYYQGSNISGNLYYSRALGEEVSHPQAWQTPKEVGVRAYPLPDASFIGDGSKNLYIIYSGVRDGMGIYEVHSDNEGDSWSEPKTIQLITQKEIFPANIEVALDRHGNLHAVWSIVSDRAIGQEIYYAKRDVDSAQWSTPYRIAAREGNDYAADWASIIEFNDELILMYMDGSKPSGIPPNRWMRRSRDGGQTWSPPLQTFSHVGEYGSAVMLIDSNQTLHIIVANRVGNPPISGMWHGVWLGDKWSDLVLITAKSPQQAVSSGSYEGVINASRPKAIVSQGNLILATWWHDMRDRPNAAYSYKMLSSPELLVKTLPAPVPDSNPVPTGANPVQQLTPIPMLEPTNISNGIPQTTSPSTLLLYGILPSTLFIASVLVVKYIQRSRV